MINLSFTIFSYPVIACLTKDVKFDVTFANVAIGISSIMFDLICDVKSFLLINFTE